MEEQQGTNNSTADKLAKFRDQMARIDSKYATDANFQKYKESLKSQGKITGKTTGRKRGTAKTNNATGERKQSDRVMNYQRFVTMLQVIPDYDRTVDGNLVKFYLMRYLKSAGYEVMISEFLYQNTLMDIFSIQSNRVVEFEIKLSREDYLNDFNKIYYMGKDRVTNDPIYLNKHAQIATAEAIVSKFYFVVPENMIDISECPPHAGLIWFKIKNGAAIFSVKKYPPLLHTRFLPTGTWATIAKRLYRQNENIHMRYSNAIYFKQYQNSINATGTAISATGSSTVGTSQPDTGKENGEEGSQAEDCPAADQS